MQQPVPHRDHNVHRIRLQVPAQQRMKVGGSQHPVAEHRPGAVELLAQPVEDLGGTVGEDGLAHERDDKGQLQPRVTDCSVQPGDERLDPVIELSEVTRLDQVQALLEPERLILGELRLARVAPLGLHQPDVPGALSYCDGVDALVPLPVDHSFAGRLVITAGHQAYGVSSQGAGKEALLAAMLVVALQVVFVNQLRVAAQQRPTNLLDLNRHPRSRLPHAHALLDALSYSCADPDLNTLELPEQHPASASVVRRLKWVPVPRLLHIPAEREPR